MCLSAPHRSRQLSGCMSKDVFVFVFQRLPQPEIILFHFKTRSCSHSKIGIPHIPACEVSNHSPLSLEEKCQQAIYHLFTGFYLFYESEMTEPRFYLYHRVETFLKALLTVHIPVYLC